jgi:hypothetical protein
VSDVPQFIVHTELIVVVVVLVVEGLVASGTNSPLTTVICGAWSLVRGVNRRELYRISVFRLV